MRYIRVLISFAVLLILFTQTRGQAPVVRPSEAASIIPPSPTAAALGKYGEIPVSLYTGVPNISIPLFTISEGGLQLPVSLSYHAGGIKVEDEASWVGLGWSLFSGGAITRSIRGLDDLRLNEERYFAGYPDYTFPISYLDYDGDISGFTNSEKSFLADINNKNKDSEPDIFYFNFGGYSGRFYINQRTSVNDPYTFHIESKEKILIQLSRKPGQYEGWQWVFTTPDGTKYYFGTEERTKSYSGAAELEVAPGPTSFPLNGEDPVISTSSWYLDKVVSQANEEITFAYTARPSYGSRKIMSLSETRNHLLEHNNAPSCGLTTPTYNRHLYMNSLNFAYEVYLSQITFSNGRLSFETSARDDIQAESPTHFIPQKLQSIKQYRTTVNGEELIKEYEFNYTYFNYTGLGSGYNMTYPTTYTGKRLKLLNLTEKAGNITQPPYQFYYSTAGYGQGDIPDKYSKSRDYWGYFNNKSNTVILDNTKLSGFVSTLIPSFLDETNSKYYAGANRDVDEQFAQIGTLNKIVYPAGGHTTFDYEGNDYSGGPPEIITQPIYHSLQAVGDLVSPEDENITPEFSATYAITLTKTTAFTVSLDGFIPFSVCNYMSWASGYVSAGFTATGSTAPLAPGSSGFGIEDILCDDLKSANKVITIPAGTYEMRVFSSNYTIANVFLRWDEQVIGNNVEIKKVGGLRLRKTVDYDGLDHSNDVVKVYNYRYNDGSGEKSSGILMTPVEYEFVHSKTEFEECPAAPPATHTVILAHEYTILARGSESNVTLGSSAQGNHVGYSVVTVLNGENGENGKTVYEYMNAAEEQYGLFFPNIPFTRKPENGLLTAETKYRADMGEFKVVERRVMEYEQEISEASSIRGFKCWGCEYAQQAMLSSLPLRIILKPYENVSQWWHLKQEVMTSFDPLDEEKSVATTTEYFYENPAHYQLTKTVKTASDGTGIVTEYTYPLDYTALNSGVIATMKDDQKYMHNSVIERVTKRRKAGVDKVTGAEFTVFSENANSIVKPSISKHLNVTGPKSGFTSSLASGTAADADYDEKMKYTYNLKGKIITVQQPGGSTTSYLWGYNGQYPIAEVKNADYSVVESALGGAVTVSDFSNSNPTDAQVNNFLMPLRGALPNAQIITYTYKPLVGMTSQTDAKGLTTYYEYDVFQRLKYIKDQDGNILKSFDYHYKP